MKRLKRFSEDLIASLGTLRALLWFWAVAAIPGATVQAALGHDWQRVLDLAVFGQVIVWLGILLVERERCPLHHEPLGPRQAIVEASIEPSADIREGARSMTELRVALIAAGYTPEQASRQLADILAAQQRGGAA